MTDLQTQQQTIAIVGGTGPMGHGLALRWAQSGYRIVLGSRDAERAAAAAAGIRQTLGAAALVEGATNAEAVAAASTVALCVPFAAHARTLQGLRSAWRAGSVLVDVTVPLAVAIGGRPTDMLGLPAGSAAEQAAQLTPQSVRVCAAFHHISAAHLRDLDHALEGDVLLCGNDRAARAAVRALVEAIPRLRPVDVGPLRRARLLEPLTALLIGINVRYKVPGAGIRITGLPEGEPHPPAPSPPSGEGE